MVVIAIISILAGMLLPALQQARRSAVAASCINNLKQSGIYINMYADENGDLIPPPEIPYGNGFSTNAADGEWSPGYMYGQRLMASVGTGYKWNADAAVVHRQIALFSCPAKPYAAGVQNVGRQLYGMNCHASGEFNARKFFRRDRETGTTVDMDLVRGVRSRTVLLADSVYAGTGVPAANTAHIGKSQFCRISSNDGKIGLLHDTRANALTFDGSVHARSIADFISVHNSNVDRIYSADGAKRY